MMNFVNYLNQLFWLILLCLLCPNEGSSNHPVQVLEPGKEVHCCRSNSEQLHIFCYNGRKKHVLFYFETVQLKISMPPEKYEQYDGFTPEEVTSKYELHRSSWNLDLFSWRSNILYLHPFNRSCIGIQRLDLSDQFSVELCIIRVDFWRFLMLLMGTLLYLCAPKLSDNPIFHYICGIAMGVTGSFLILVYLISKLFPKNRIMYAFILGSSTVSIYFVRLLWENVQLIVQQYQAHVVAYIVLTGLISFVICYRLGPVTNPRSKNLIKWALQIAGLTMIFFSSHLQEGAISFIIALIIIFNIPSLWISKLISFWKRKFPPKCKLLSEEEYHQQAAVETARALDELRGYCSSPESKPWKTVLALKNPIRFAKFVEGSSHLNDEEVLAYESDSRRFTSNYYTDDDSDLSEEEY